jgi:hypothetical protein
MAQARRQFTDDFKREAVALLVSSGRSTSTVETTTLSFSLRHRSMPVFRPVTGHSIGRRRRQAGLNKGILNLIASSIARVACGAARQEPVHIVCDC